MLGPSLFFIFRSEIKSFVYKECGQQSGNGIKARKNKQIEKTHK